MIESVPRLAVPVSEMAQDVSPGAVAFPVAVQAIAAALVKAPCAVPVSFRSPAHVAVNEPFAELPVCSLTFGVAICHEGWRYPETVRWAARRGAQVVFHPHFHEAEPGSYRPSTFADPANTFHEKAALCRAADNTCFFATVNCASEGSPTTSAVVRPDGTLLDYQPYGKEGLLIADLPLGDATGLLAARARL